MHFTKMHGIGNDYVYVDGSKERVTDAPEVARRISDRHTGIGSDGLILINPSEKADFEMEMYNADGSRGRMCGNGIRCVGKYVYDHGLTDRKELLIETLSGVKHLSLRTGGDGRVREVTVDMGEPVFAPEEIPVDPACLPGNCPVPIVDMPYEVGGRTYRVTCLSMGNPHCVVFSDTPVEELDLLAVGPRFECAPLFPERVNTEFVNVEDRTHLRMRVYERGSGETEACGTGACAAAVAAYLNGYTERCVTVRLRGGDLGIRCGEDDGRVYMTGPAEEVFSGDIAL